MDYKSSGVDVEAGRAFVNQIKQCVEATHQSEVIGGLGGFGGAIKIPKGVSSPVLIAATDGVGTKLELAQDYQSHFGVGVDLVAMCLNDVITSGAKPLLFLDYMAMGVLAPDAMKEVIKGIAHACKICDCALLGGETAEMPGFYPSGRYDLAGFCVGVVDEKNLINGHKIKKNHQIIAIASSGVHSNGFSLVREILKKNGLNNQSFIDKNYPSLIEILLQPTFLYYPLIKDLLNANVSIDGMAHITGGGLPENLPRSIPNGLKAYIDSKSWNIPSIFSQLQEMGGVPVSDMWNTFNMGVGFCLFVPSDNVDQILTICKKNQLDSWLLGEVVESSSHDQEPILGITN